ncbi:hypothetical protein ACK8HY_20630 [Sphingobacterium sp. NGMCC 1.201703]|uniref:hypothetical protein n=1 Tax=Sphingobacterium sp. NGMCC 1.201703 TaxID=3388657 RepID=UPI0039FD1E9D
MKTRLVTLLFILFTITSFAQKASNLPFQHTATDSTGVFRLFPTENGYTFIKLNTRNGKMWQVKWDTKNKKVNPVSDAALVNKDDEKNGRFMLYPTVNIYNFILLDQLDGRMWNVKWKHEHEWRVFLIE